MEEENLLYNLPTESRLTESKVREIIMEMISNQNQASIMSDGYFKSANFVSGSQGWRLTSDSVEINTPTSIQSLNIPDTTTADSFHVDSSGNAWWGANLATGYTGANAYILASGGAVFKNVQIGGTTIQYVITNSGIFSFGDGSDGDVTITTDTTLTSDKYYDNLTVNNGATLNPGGYRIFVKNTLTLSGNGKIARNGNNGSGVTGGAALADGYLKGSLAGTNGTAGATNNNAVDADDGAATTNSLGSNGSTGGTGGASGTGYRTPGAGGTGGTRTIANTKLIANWHLATLLDVGTTGATVKYDNSAGAGGGGGGGSSFDSPIANGGAGGGAGSHGGIVAIYARIISIASGSSITANGGAGANGVAGDTGVNVGGSGGGGGAGGNGGIIILVYNQLTNGGSITVTAGAKGTGGAAGGGTTPGLPGNDGTIGSAGTIYQFQLSL